MSHQDSGSLSKRNDDIKVEDTYDRRIFSFMHNGDHHSNNVPGHMIPMNKSMELPLGNFTKKASNKYQKN